MKKITLAMLLAFSGLTAQIINTAPYILTVDEAKIWFPESPLASPDLIATVPLAARFTNQQTQFNPALTNDMQIAYLPDGMNNFGNYYGEQSQFNLFNFTHWQYIDKLVWFGGTASQSVQLPSSPWVNAAHKNGVKVFGDIFFAPSAFGGSTANLQNFLEQDTEGHFVIIPRLVAMAEYYGFDGWFINQETSTNATTAQLMYQFVRDFTFSAEQAGKEVMWYDAMILSGGVGWQNRLNTSNSPFVQNDQDGDTANGSEQRVSSSIFINFSWNTSALPSVSRNRAQAIGRSQFEVFTGADIWPGRNQGDFEINGNTFMTRLHENETTPYTSLGLFAPNCVYNNSAYTNFNNDPTDYASFYDAENHLFSGDDNNPGITDVTGFKGFCNWVPEATVITSLPFETNFSTGHGLRKFSDGIQTSGVAWHNMNDQSILPTWQFAFSPIDTTLRAGWDFNDAFNFGNSLKVYGDLAEGTITDLMLYKTQLPVTAATAIDLTYKCNIFPGMQLIVVFADDIAHKYEFPVDNGISGDWITRAFPMSEFAGREIVMIGLRFAPTASLEGYQMNIGTLKVYNGVLSVAQNVKEDFVTVSYPGQKPIFTINWPGAVRLSYTVLSIDGSEIDRGNIIAEKMKIFQIPASLEAGTYIIKFTDQHNLPEIKKIIMR